MGTSRQTNTDVDDCFHFSERIVSGHQLFLTSSNYTIFQCTLSRLIERMFDTLQQQTFHFSPNYVKMPNLHLPVLATLNIP